MPKFAPKCRIMRFLPYSCRDRRKSLESYKNSFHKAKIYCVFSCEASYSFTTLISPLCFLLINPSTQPLYIVYKHTHKSVGGTPKYLLRHNIPAAVPKECHESDYLRLLSFPVYLSNDPIPKSLLRFFNK